MKYRVKFETDADEEIGGVFTAFDSDKLCIALSESIKSVEGQGYKIKKIELVAFGE